MPPDAGDRARAVPLVAAENAADLLVLGPAAELAHDKRSVLTVGRLELLVIFARGRFTVVENRCPHGGWRLDDARVRRRTLTCSVHSFRYSLSDGACRPALGSRAAGGGRLVLFPTRVVNGWLYAVVDRREAGGS